jgi:hypothetical protein
VSLPGHLSFLFAGVEGLAREQATKEDDRGRWIEVRCFDDRVNVLTKGMDRYTDVLADGLAQAIAQSWNGEYKPEPEPQKPGTTKERELDPQGAHELRQEFAVVLDDVFGERSSKFSEELRGFLLHMWVRGIRHGLYARDKRKPVPEAVVWSSMDEQTPAQRRMDEAERTKARIIEMADEIAMRLETAIMPSGLKRLEGDALIKGTHNFVVRTSRIEKRLRDILNEVEKFRLFEP